LISQQNILDSKAKLLVEMTIEIISNTCAFWAGLVCCCNTCGLIWIQKESALMITHLSLQ